MRLEENPEPLYTTMKANLSYLSEAVLNTGNDADASV